jgi:hypothetical protein
MTGVEANDAKVEIEKVKLLFEYTKFHIGLYTTLGTVFVGAVNFLKKSDNFLAVPFCSGYLWTAVALLALAGFSGGIIASTLPHHNTVGSFWVTPVGPFRTQLMAGQYWTYVEHTAFWASLVAAVLAFLLPRCCA